MHWNHSHPCKADHPKKCFYKIVFGTHSRHWLRWIFLIPCFRLFLLCAVLALLFAFLHSLTCACWKTIKESGYSWTIHWSWFASLHMWKSVFSWSGTGWFLWLLCDHSRDLWSALVQPPAWRGLSQPLHEVKHSFIQPAALKEPSINIQPQNNLFQCCSSTSFRRDDLVLITQFISRTRCLLRPTLRTSKKNLGNFKIPERKVLW